MKIEATWPIEARSHWKIVRTDNFTDVPGTILCANEESGECIMAEDSNRILSFGPGGMRIVPAARYRG